MDTGSPSTTYVATAVAGRKDAGRPKLRGSSVSYRLFAMDARENGGLVLMATSRASVIVNRPFCAGVTRQPSAASIATLDRVTAVEPRIAKSVCTSKVCPGTGANETDAIADKSTPIAALIAS